MPRSNLCKSNSTIAAEKLVRWIKRQGTQTEIAAGIGISKQLLNYKLKSGSLTASDLIKIFHYLGTDADEIIKVMTY